MLSLQKILASRDNDYTKLAKSFKERTRLDIIKNGWAKKVPLNKSCSIIIPFYRDQSALKRNLTALAYQDLPPDFKLNKVEIIIIDGGSLFNLRNLVKFIRRFYFVTYLKLKKNYGRATARNLGLLYSKNDIVIFLDEDIVVSNDFIGSHLLRHEFLNKCIIVGFRQNIDSRKLLLRMDTGKQIVSRKPDYKNDFRYKRFVPVEWKGAYNDVPFNNFNRTYHLLRETDYFKKFGKGKIIGVWDLPFMFLTCNASVSRKYVSEVGGFDMRFKGWNLEDTHLGAKLIARGLYLIPNLHATVYHLVKKVFAKEYKIKRIKEFEKNVKLYKEFKNENFIIQKEHKWKEKMKRYFTNKFELIRL